jgi:hypothetical protein
MNLSTRLFLALSIAPFLVAQTKYQNDVMSMSPLGFWPLNGNPSDISGHGNNGTLMNGAFFSNLFTSPVGPQSLVVNGANNQFVVMPGSSTLFNLGGLHPLTAIAWVKTVRQGNGVMTLVGKGDATGTGWVMDIDNGDSSDPSSSGRLVFIFGVANNPTLLVEAPQSKNDGGWHMLAATYDGSGSASGVKLYIDGLIATNLSVGADKISSGSILNSAPLSIGALPDQSDQFDGSISGVAVFGTALTPAQILQLAEDAGTARAFLGQFAFGGGWYSAIYFTNISLTDVSFPVTFTADNGTALTVPSIGGPSKTITLAAGGSTVIEAPNVGDLQQGYVSVTLPAGAIGYGVFRQSIPGKPDQEAVVPLSLQGGNIPLIFDETKYTTAVSIADPGNVTSTIAITATDNTGAVIGTSTLTLSAFNKTAVVLRSLPGLEGIAGKQGSARFSVTNGPGVVVLGLRANGTALTSIPAQPQSFKFIGTP